MELAAVRNRMVSAAIAKAIIIFILVFVGHCIRLVQHDGQRAASRGGSIIKPCAKVPSEGRMNLETM